MKKSVKCIRISSRFIGKGAEYSIKGAGKLLGTAARATKHEKLASGTEKTFNIIGEGIGKGTEITGMGVGYVIDKAIDANEKRKKQKYHQNTFIVVSRKNLNE